MKVCTKCKTNKSLSDYGLYVSGTVKAKCKACAALYAKERRQAYVNGDVKKQPNYVPDCTQMRHPDPLFMKAQVKKMARFYRKQKAKLKQAGLGVRSPAGVCDMVLETT
jgi:hypothetical protein